MARLILLGIFLPFFLLIFWFRKRLRDALAERHPDVLQAIDAMPLAGSRAQRGAVRHLRYRTLNDPEIERHARNLERAETALQYLVLGFFALVMIFLAISAMHR